MAGCKRCALKRRKGKGKKKIKEKKRKKLDQNRLVFVGFFYKSTRMFFICAVVISRIYKENCI